MCPSTLGLSCSFDERFLTDLAEKMATKSPMKRGGRLLRDKIQVRNVIAVNSKTMTYSGFVDHGHPDEDCKDLADHGPDFLSLLRLATTTFSSFWFSLERYHGTVLSQLLLESTVKLERAGVHVDSVNQPQHVEKL